MFGLKYTDQIRPPVSDEFQNLATALKSFLLVSHNEDGTLNATAISFITSFTGPSPASTTTALDGTSGGGASLLYSRGDHKHADANRPTTGEKAQLTRLTASTVTLTDGATPSLNSALGTVFKLSAAGNRTIAVPTNPGSGWQLIIQHFANGGARTLSLNSGAGGFRFGTTITALSATASGKTDYITCLYNATDNFWDVINYVKEF